MRVDIADHVADAVPELAQSLPSHLIDDAETVLLDLLAAAFASRRYRASTPSAPGVCTLIGDSRDASQEEAIYENARLINFLDFDETFNMQSHHGGAAFAVSFALAEARDVAGTDVLRGFVVGYEIAARLAVSLLPSKDSLTNVARWPGLFGPILPCVAAATAAAVVERASPTVTAEALRLSVAYAPQRVSRWQGKGAPPSTKYIDAGWAARAGLQAYRAAAAGETGPRGALEDVLPATLRSGEGQTTKMTDALGERWYFIDRSLKPWPCCRWLHTGLTALTRLLPEVCGDLLEIDNVTFRVVPQVAEAGVMPEEYLAGQVAAMFSFPHAAAMILSRIPAGHAWFDRAVIEPEYFRAFRRRVQVVATQATMQFADRPRLALSVPASVEVSVQGRVVTADASNALGDPSYPTPFDRAAVVQKLGSQTGDLSADIAVTVASLRQVSARAFGAGLRRALL